MNAAIVSKENTKVKFTMAFTAEEFEAEIQKSYQKNKGKYRVDGFRQGKASRKMIERMYGEGVFWEDAIDALLQDNFGKALDELAIEPVDRPEMNFLDEKVDPKNGLNVEIAVEVAPEIEVKNYKGVKAEIEKVDYNIDELIDNELKAMQEKNARLVTAAEGAEAKEGDTVTLDYAGFVGEEQFEGGTAEGYALELGSHSFIPGFEEQLVGCKAGESKDVNVTFPAEYHSEELAGKEAVFKCTVHEIKVKEIPELNDDFAMDVSETADTLEDLKKEIREKQEKTIADGKEFTSKNAVLAKVCEENDKFDVPKGMIESEINVMMQEFESQLMQSGLNLETYCQYLGKKAEELRAEFAKDAESRVKTKLIVKTIAKAEGIEATEEDLEEEFANVAKMYNMDVEQIKNIMKGSESMMKEDIASRKVIDMLYKEAEITEIEKKEEKAEEKAE